jgi:3-isopropylmalate/(R)-2-methylmalate dehydratase small subunit
VNGGAHVPYVFGDDFDIDEIIGIENIRTFDLDVLRAACMRDLDPGFRSRVAAGDWLVGGHNFGYGHPHDQPMMVMRDLGVVGVIAESFAPLFARGETYNGFPLVVCPGIQAAARTGDAIDVQWRDGRITLRDSTVLASTPVPENQARMIDGGGGAALLLAARTSTGSES